MVPTRRLRGKQPAEGKAGGAAGKGGKGGKGKVKLVLGSPVLLRILLFKHNTGLPRAADSSTGAGPPSRFSSSCRS